MKIALVAALALAVTAAQAQQTPDKGTQDRGYGQEKRAGEEMHGQKGVKVSNSSEWQFHKADEQHKGEVEATGNVQCAEPFGKMKGGLVAKVAKLEAGSRFKVTAKDDMYLHVHEGSLSFSEAGAAAGQPPGQERRFGQEQQQPGQAHAGMDKTARAGAIVHIPAGTTCWVSSTGQTTAVVFTKSGESATGERESQEPKTDVK